MDIDVVEKNGRAVLAFKGEMETLLPQLRKAVIDAAAVAGDAEQVRELLMPALEKIEEMRPAVEAVVDDIAQIKETLGPALAWIAEQQKVIDEAKAKTEAEEKLKAEAAAKAHVELDAKAAEKPSADKPLERIAEVEGTISASPPEIDEPAFGLPPQGASS